MYHQFIFDKRYKSHQCVSHEGGFLLGYGRWWHLSNSDWFEGPSNVAPFPRPRPRSRPWSWTWSSPYCSTIGVGKYCICVATSSLNGCSNDCGDKAMSGVVGGVSYTLILDNIGIWKEGPSI